MERDIRKRIRLTGAASLVHSSSMRWLLLTLCLLSWTLMVPLASAGGPGFRFQIRDRVLYGQEKPAVILVPDDRIKRMRLTLNRGSGRPIVLKAKNLRPRAEREFSWKQKPGTVHYAATLTSMAADGRETTSHFEFDVVVSPPMTLRVSKSLENLSEHRVEFSANQPVSRAEFQVADDSGVVIRSGERTYGPAEPGAPIQIAWKPVEGEIRRIHIKAYDPAGFWSGVELCPFYVEIPHEEVVFASGRAEIRESERPKLDSTLKQIELQKRKYEGDPSLGAAGPQCSVALGLRLYVSGYTDTVGPAKDNMGLSRKRAKAIAGFFKASRLGLPVFYQGFGESVLAVQTPDNTDSEANRRALYILGNAPPPRSVSLPAGHWTRLP